MNRPDDNDITAVAAALESYRQALPTGRHVRHDGTYLVGLAHLRNAVERVYQATLGVSEAPE